MKGESIVTGKRGEFRVIGRLLSYGFCIYTPVCDVEGIDCILRNEKGRLIEIQIKTRNKNGDDKKDFSIKDFKPNIDFFIICYYLDTDEMWVLPSYLYMKESILNKEGRRVLVMSQNKERTLSKYFDKWGLDLLKMGEFKPVN